MKRIPLAFCLLLATYPLLAQQGQSQASSKKKILIHLTHGKENPTVAALAFLMAKTAIEEGHSVSLFLAGDAVPLLQDQILDTVTGLGTGKLREHFDAIVKGGGKFYLSGMSSKVRGVTEADVQGKPVEFALPTVLLKLSLESDRMFVY
jgi:uncharacterized protein